MSVLPGTVWLRTTASGRRPKAAQQLWFSLENTRENVRSVRVGNDFVWDSLGVFQKEG